MFRARRRTALRRQIVPPLMFVGTVALMSLAAAQLTAAAPLQAGVHAAPALGSPCPVGPSLVGAAAARHTSTVTADAEDNLDVDGTYLGQTLTIAGGASTSPVSLPAESFIGTRSGDALVYSLFVNGKSEVDVLDVGNGCDSVVARPAGIVRSAVLDPTASAVYVHAVSNPDRNDLGVSRYALDGGNAVLAVPPLPDDPDFGPTYATQLGWSTYGSELFVQSCGAAQCRTRVLEIASGAMSTFDDAGQGSIVGLTSQHLVAFGPCDGSPCDVISVDRSSGATTILAQGAISATLDEAADGTTEATITTSAGTTEVDQ